MVSLKIPFFPQLIRMRLVHKFGLDISPGSVIGQGLRIEHPVGIVLGASVRIGMNCTIMHNLTIGERYVDARSTGANPTIGDNVIIGIGAIILGYIRIGNNCKILSGSTVLANVADGVSVHGLIK
jgi:serine O-acetyltransferase